MRRLSRELVEVAQRIYTERGDDRKSLIDTRDAAVIIAMKIERYAAPSRPATPSVPRRMRRRAARH